MRGFQPPTILHLVLVGFFVVLLPLLLGTVRGFISLDRVANQHQRDTSDIVLLTRSMKSIQGNLEDLERSARQFQLIGDESFLGMFNEKFVVIQQALARIQSLNQGEKLVPLVGVLIRELDKLYQGVNNTDVQSPDFLVLLTRFERIFFLFQTLNHEGSNFLTERVEDAQRSVEDVSEELMVYLLTLLPFTILLVVLFTSLIVKPLRQISTAIRKLGEGQYHESFEVQGPLDLQRVAKRLSWLGKKLADSENEKKSFLRHISHELKTPLSTIKEGTGLLEDEVPGVLNDSQKEVVGILSQAVSSFQNLINNLLDFNLLKRDRTLHSEICDMDAIVADTINSYTLTAKKKNISIRVVGDKISVKADQSVLKAAIDNLVSNAVHFSPKGGFVEVKWNVEKNKNLRVSVIDSGPGIPEGEREKIFLPFYQGTARKIGPLKGTGLGLSVVKECVESHGGSVGVEDSLVGARLHIEIPDIVLEECEV